MPKYKISVAKLCRNQTYEPHSSEAISPLVDAVIEEIKSDLEWNDLTCLDELLRFVPRKFLIGFLRDDEKHDRFRK